MLNGYICLLASKRHEVYAETPYAAKKQAAAHWKVKEGSKRYYDISVMLAETNVDPETLKGEQYVHSTAGL